MEEKLTSSEEYHEAVKSGAVLPRVHFFDVLWAQFSRPMIIGGVFKFFNDVSQVIGGLTS